MSRTGENYAGDTLQFFILLVQHLDSEAQKATQFAQQARLMELQTLAQATSQEQAVNIAKAFTDVVTRAITPTNTRTDTKAQAQNAEFAKRKIQAVRSLAIGDKGFSSLGDIMSALNNRIEPSGD